MSMPPSPGFSLKQIAFPAFGPSILYGLAEGAVLPVIALMARDLQASVALAGFIVALAGIGSLVSNVPAAVLTSRFGERRAMIGAAITSILAYVLCILADHIVVLAIGVLLGGMAGSVFALARQTWLIAAVPFGLRARALSTLAGSVRIGAFVGPFAGAGMIHLTSLHGAYAVSIVAMIGLGLIVWHLPELPEAVDGSSQPRPAGTHPDAGSPSFAALLRDHARVLMTLGIGILLVSALRTSRQAVIPLWGDALGLPAAATSMVFGLAALLDMAMFYPAGKVMDRYGRIWVAVPCTLLMGIALMLMPLTSGLVGFMAVALLLGFGNGIGSGIVMTLGADASPKLGRTRFLGIWRILADIGASSGPLVLSAGTILLSLPGGIVASGVLGLIAASVFLCHLPRRPMADPDQPAGRR